jgi:hypothetical protein
MSQREAISSSPPDAVRLRALLSKADLSEGAAAIVLDLDEADIRAHVAPEKPLLRVVILEVGDWRVSSF